MPESQGATVPIHISTLAACCLFASKDDERYYLEHIPMQ
jgi:hypothetical protein